MGGISNNPTAQSIGAVPTSRQVIAGTNMSGGGALSSDVTLDAVGGGGGSANNYVVYEFGPENTPVTLNINSAAYLAYLPFVFFLDRDTFPATEYRIMIRGNANAAGQTITAQLALGNTPATPLHTGGDDIVITDIFDIWDSGWLTLDDGGSGTEALCVALKGSNATVDLTLYYAAVMFRINSQEIDSDTVLTDQSTTSTSFTDLATVGPTVTLETGTEVLVTMNVTAYKTGSGFVTGHIGLDVSGATTIAPTVNQMYVSSQNTQLYSISRTFKLTGLNEGSNTFTLKYMTEGGTYHFLNRDLTIQRL